MKYLSKAIAIFMIISMISVVGISKGQICGPMDVAFIIDDTGSMGSAIGAIQSGLGGSGGIIEQLQTASGGDLKLGLITFKDTVDVDSKLTTDITSVSTAISGLGASGGSGTPEASDEALNTAVNNLASRAGQIGDFDEPWRNTALKIIIIITDAPPGGFNDIKDASDLTNIHNHAVTAASKDIRISAIYFDTGVSDPDTPAYLQDLATTTSGVYIEADSGEDVANGVQAIIDECGGAGEMIHPVGGKVMAPNKVSILSPWIVLAALVSIIALIGYNRRQR